MEKQQSNDRHWLDILETLLAIGSIGGSVASLVSQQVFFASLPLSLAVTLNLVNRKRLLSLVNRSTRTEIAELSQQSQEHQANIKTLSEQLTTEVQRLPIAQLLQQSQEQQANIKTLSEQLTTEVQRLPIAQLLQQSQEHRANIKTLSEQMIEIQRLTTDLSSHTQELQNYVQSQEAKEKLTEEVGRLSEIENSSQAVRDIPNTAELYYQQGLDLQDSGNSQSAVDAYNEAIRLHPHYALAYHKRGLVRFALGDKKAAIEDLKKAAKLYFQQGNLGNYQTVKYLSKEFHDLSSNTTNQTSKKLILDGLFS